MSLPISGQISLLSLQNEFGGTNSIEIGEYYGRDAGIPASGTISLNDFYGKSSEWTTYIMGYSAITDLYNTTNSYSGNIVSLGSNHSPTTFTIYFDRRHQNTTGSLSIYVNEVLDSTYTNGEVGNINASNPSISFGSYSIRFSSTLNDTSSITSNGPSWNVFVGDTLIYHHDFEHYTVG